MIYKEFYCNPLIINNTYALFVFKSKEEEKFQIYIG